jgi:hypothetical protein
MRRQPFLPAYQTQGYSIGAKIIDDRPDFVAAIGRCLTLWPFVEHQLALILGVLIRAENEASIAVFNALRTGRSQRDALNAAAATTLDPVMLRLFEAMLSVVEAAANSRADLAHGVWGIMPNVPDKVVWVESKFHSPWNTLVLNKETRGEYVGHEPLKQNLCVVSLPDIEEVREQIDETWKITFEFVDMLRNPNLASGFGRGAEERLRGMYELPRIAVAVNRQHRRSNRATNLE